MPLHTLSFGMRRLSCLPIFAFAMMMPRLSPFLCRALRPKGFGRTDAEPAAACGRLQNSLFIAVCRRSCHDPWSFAPRAPARCRLSRQKCITGLHHAAAGAPEIIVAVAFVVDLMEVLGLSLGNLDAIMAHVADFVRRFPSPSMMVAFLARWTVDGRAALIWERAVGSAFRLVTLAL